MDRPRRPESVPAHAQACLEAIADTGRGNRISLGGAFGLAHYFEYRRTHDVDAWWDKTATRDEQQAIVQAVETALNRFGDVRTRAWGDVVSVELRQQNQTVFSFQIARRSAELETPIAGIWPGGIQVDSFRDLVASKMVALVERGAPRDFLDIYTLCTSGECTEMQSWEWWEARHQTANQVPDRQRAALAIRTHLARIEQTRPLTTIVDDEQRAAAERLRRWFIEVFLRGLPD